MQMIDCMIEQDPSLSARRTTDMRRYIVNRWNHTHEEPIDEDAVVLFLCDESRGTLTDELRIFTRECREEIKACYRNVVFQMFQCGEMMRQYLVSGPEEYCRIFLPQYAVPCNKQLPRVTACEGLCASISGGAEPCPSRRVWASVGRLWEALRYKASAFLNGTKGRKKKQEKGPAL